MMYAPSKAPPYVAIVTIGRGTCLYTGMSVSIAAGQLEPGTCFGKGWSEQGAIQDAESWRKFFLERQAGSILSARKPN